MNSNFKYTVFNPEHLVDLLRAGGNFPVWQSFTIPARGSEENEILKFINTSFPALSEERYEIWVKFHYCDNKDSTWYSLEDIESIHFYNQHRQEAESQSVINTINNYGIHIGEPIILLHEEIISVYSEMSRRFSASLIVKAWFPDIKISEEFTTQVKIGYRYQQSPNPEKLPPISSNYIWAHMVAYNAGLRKFDERPAVLWLQDIQEIIRRTDSDFKQKLKAIGDRYSQKFSDLVDDAESSKKSGIEPSKWIILNLNKGKSYFFELDQFLSGLGGQKCFFYTALLYMNWREKILDTDFTGRLADNKLVSYFLNNSTDNFLRQSVAEALFTIVYAGGARVFQKALIEARMKILHISDVDPDIKIDKTPFVSVEQHALKPLIGRIFENVKKELGKLFSTLFNKQSEEKKKKLEKEIKAISLTKSKMAKGEFNHEQYISLCSVFDVSIEKFSGHTNDTKLINNSDDGVGSIKVLHKIEAEQVTILKMEKTDQIDGIPKEPQFDLLNKQSEILADEEKDTVIPKLKSKTSKKPPTGKVKKEKKPGKSTDVEINFPSDDISKEINNPNDSEGNAT